jgi:predicted amidophosphoribosyltransferase
MLRHAWALLAPPLCGSCAGPTSAGEALCGTCAAALGRATPFALTVLAANWTLAAAPYDGVPRAVVTALKFRGGLPLAEPMAVAIADAAGTRLDGHALVPVPPAPRRRRRRGFDPADEIARALARRTGLPLVRCLVRANGPRQVGRARHDRLASPPLVHAARAVPARAVLVDDVVTTGATLMACATELRAAGAREVCAVAFAGVK